MNPLTFFEYSLALAGSIAAIGVVTIALRIVWLTLFGRLGQSRRD